MVLYGKIESKTDYILPSFNKLKQSIDLHEQYAEKEGPLSLATQDSVIQRFEYCTDLLWKSLNFFLEDFEKITLESVSPKSIIRQSVTNRLLSADESQDCLEMIKKRNGTSHIYHEEVAEDIIIHVPKFYELMDSILTRVQNRIK